MLRAVVSAGGVLAAGFLGIPLAFAPGDLPPSTAADTGIPAVVLAAYQRSGDACPGLRWELLAGIGQVESGHGSAGGSVVAADGTISPPILGPPLDGTGVGGNTTPMPVGEWAGRWGLPGPWLQAVGPMQFLPGTFDAWAVDGDANGSIDPHDVDDAVASAAAYLCGPTERVDDERAALQRYNASDAYIDEVLAWAEQYALSPPLIVDTGGDASTLLANPVVTIYADGRTDLAAGRVDSRVIAVLLTLARDHTIVVTSLVTGHPRCAVNGQAQGPDCDVSNHYLGRGADIAVLDGIPISVRHPSIVAIMNELASLGEPFRPDEIGGPIDTGQPGVFTNSFHADHIHIGWDT